MLKFLVESKCQMIASFLFQKKYWSTIDHLLLLQKKYSSILTLSLERNISLHIHQ